MKFQKACKQKIAEIMDGFDFGQVQKIMQDLNWSWGNDSEIPSMPCIIKAAERQLKDVCHKLEKLDFIYISSGGFTTIGWTGYDEDEGKKYVNLMLIFGISATSDGICFKS